MNAKWIPASGAAIGAAWLSVCLTSAAYSQPTPGVANSAASVGQSQRPTRSDVDALLKRAQVAILAGNFDRAEAMVAWAERTGIRYPLFHFGPTPASLRRELSQARTIAPSTNTSTTTPANAVVRAVLEDRGVTGAAVDPFIERPLVVPAAPISQPLPPSMGGGMDPPVVPALHYQPMGVSNRLVQHASAANQDDPWAQRDAPLPPSLSEAQLANESAPRLVAPEQLASPSADDDRADLDDSSPTTPANQKSLALDLLRAARQALVAGKLERAEEYARNASALAVPESAFLPHEDRPSLLAWDIHRVRESQPRQAATQTAPADRYAAQTQHAPEHDATLNVQATTAPATSANISEMRFAQLPEPLELPGEGADFFVEAPLPAATAKPIAHPPAPGGVTVTELTPPPPVESDAARLLRTGEEALRERDQPAAAVLFGQAYLIREQLDPTEQTRLQKHLQMLSSTEPTADESVPQKMTPTLIDTARDSQQVFARQISAEVGKKQAEARRIRDKDPEQSLQMLQTMRQKVTESQLTGEYRHQLLRRIDITLDETEKYIHDHQAEIDLERRNQAVLAEVERHREVKIKVQQQIAELVDKYNQLRDDQRYAEMEVIARRLFELAPDEPVAKQVLLNSKFIRRTIMNEQLADARETANWRVWHDVEQALVQNVFDGQEMSYVKEWPDLVKNRKSSGDRNPHRTERELEIQRRLKTPVLLRYENTPLSEVVQGLAELAGVNIHLDDRGLSQEGWNSDTPVTINLSKEIQLKSALSLILEPLHLTYMIKDEVLKITSEQLRDGDIKPLAYNVADLVIPIPNFVPNNNIGLQGLINEAHAAMGYATSGLGMPGPSVLVNDAGRGQSTLASNNVLAQQFGGGGLGGPPSPSIPIGSGPGGMGGGAQADFDSLIDLIVSTIATDTWAENGGGEAEIRPFPTNLSLVISQTQAIHEEIADLLEQLRRLQDLQVTIEVRFIRLNDSFFERIGVDFDVNIEDRTIGTADLIPGAVYEPRRQSAVVGLQFPVDGTAPFPNFTSDLDIPFRQNSFNLTRPVFGGVSAALPSFGFAILSDIEAYFLIEAAQGDRRTNVLNAPKVTLFNGQQAFVADAVSQPFVIGVIPIVGEFAAAQQPVIVVLNEGTLMTIQAVVSDDRRYVRMTVVPFFTQVGDVQEFTFDGATSSTNASSTTDDDDDGNNESADDSNAVTRSGVTVQLPSFQFISVVTTVSVPDGGTVLLGGIKRLSEGRNEVGVPLLSKVPYINRLFRNVGIGRETDSLMMMVTPRIIIQEEEEERFIQGF